MEVPFKLVGVSNHTLCACNPNVQAEKSVAAAKIYFFGVMFLNERGGLLLCFKRFKNAVGRVGHHL